MLGGEGEEGNWSGPPVPKSERGEEDPDAVSLSEDEETDARLDLENLSLTESSLNTTESVSDAITVVRKACAKVSHNTTERKDLVNKLILLQIRLEDLKEREDNPDLSVKADTHGHRFVEYGTGVTIPGVSSARHIYCQVCCGSIWVYLQASQHCKECGYSVHTTCMSQIMRDCVGIKVRAQPDFIMKICPRKTLKELNYHCVECDREFFANVPEAKPRLCDYTGLYFCPSCHWQAQAVCPSRIVHNWQFHPTIVSQASKQYLYLMHNKPVISVEKESPVTFAVIPELQRSKQLRESILAMKRYLTVCRIASEEKLLLELASRQHFVENSEYYSIADLLDMHSGALETFLLRVTKLFSDHIRACVLCRAKGFICEICRSGDEGAVVAMGLDGSEDKDLEIIFPFDDLVSECSKCKSVFHKECFKDYKDKKGKECPKCARLKARKE